jgi:hypothetical protein
MGEQAKVDNPITSGSIKGPPTIEHIFKMLDLLQKNNIKSPWTAKYEIKGVIHELHISSFKRYPMDQGK